MNQLSIFVERFLFFVMRLIIGRKRRDNIRYKHQVLKKSKIVQKIGPEALSVFSSIATEEECKFWPFWGTLLGAYREHGFIKHDDDIDIGMFDKDITLSLIDKMIKCGFCIIQVIVDKDFVGGYHLAFKYKNIKFDIYSFHKELDSSTVSVFCPLPYNYAKWGKADRKDIFDILHVYVNSWENFIDVPFENIKLPIPANSDEILRILYGDSFMTPIVGQKTEEVHNPAKKHENPQIHYACGMNYEVFRMLKRAELL